MKYAGLSHQYWEEGFLHAVYLYNRTSTSVLNMSATIEKLFGSAPSNASVQVFGSAAYVHKEESERLKKLDSHAEMGDYMGNRDYMHCTYYPRKQKSVLTNTTHLIEISFHSFRDSQDLYTSGRDI